MISVVIKGVTLASSSPGDHPPAGISDHQMTEVITFSKIKTIAVPVKIICPFLLFFFVYLGFHW